MMSLVKLLSATVISLLLLTAPALAGEGGSTIRNLFELEMGLPYRFQVDLYLVARRESNNPGKQTFLDQQ